MFPLLAAALMGMLLLFSADRVDLRRPILRLIGPSPPRVPVYTSAVVGHFHKGRWIYERTSQFAESGFLSASQQPLVSPSPAVSLSATLQDTAAGSTSSPSSPSSPPLAGFHDNTSTYQRERLETLSRTSDLWILVALLAILAGVITKVRRRTSWPSAAATTTTSFSSSSRRRRSRSPLVVRFSFAPVALQPRLTGSDAPTCSAIPASAPLSAASSAAATPWDFSLIESQVALEQQFALSQQAFEAERAAHLKEVATATAELESSQERLMALQGEFEGTRQVLHSKMAQDGLRARDSQAERNRLEARARAAENELRAAENELQAAHDLRADDTLRRRDVAARDELQMQLDQTTRARTELETQLADVSSSRDELQRRLEASDASAARQLAESSSARDALDRQLNKAGQKLAEAQRARTLAEEVTTQASVLREEAVRARDTERRREEQTARARDEAARARDGLAIQLKAATARLAEVAESTQPPAAQPTQAPSLLQAHIDAGNAAARERRLAEELQAAKQSAAEFRRVFEAARRSAAEWEAACKEAWGKNAEWKAYSTKLEGSIVELQSQVGELRRATTTTTAATTASTAGLATTADTTTTTTTTEVAAGDANTDNAPAASQARHEETAPPGLEPQGSGAPSGGADNTTTTGTEAGSSVVAREDPAPEAAGADAATAATEEAEASADESEEAPSGDVAQSGGEAAPQAEGKKRTRGTRAGKKRKNRAYRQQDPQQGGA